MRVRVERIVDDEEWNRLIVSCPGGSLFQSTYWARLMDEYLGIPGYFMSAFDRAGQTVGCLLFFNEPPGYRRLFFERPLSGISLPVLRWALPSLTWLRGPLVTCSDPRERSTVCERMLAEVNEFGSNMGAVGVAPSPAPIHGVSGSEFEEIYTDLGFSQNQWATFLVDLTPEEDVLWGRLDRSARKAIRKTEREGVQVERIATLEELEQYYLQAAPYWQSRGARVFSFRNYSAMWQSLRPGEALEVFVARRGSEMLGGLGVWVYNGVMMEFGVVRAMESTGVNLHPGDLIKWEIMKWGHRMGHRTYDLAGVSPDPSTPKEEGIHRYKKKWGGEQVSYPVYERPFSGIKCSLVTTATRAVRAFL